MNYKETDIWFFILTKNHIFQKSMNIFKALKEYKQNRKQVSLKVNCKEKYLSEIKAK